MIVDILAESGKRKKHLGRHDSLVFDLAERLNDVGRYDFLMVNMDYFTRDLQGEVDVLAWNVQRDSYVFYEVKCHYSLSSWVKACRQYVRFKTAFPERRVKGVFVSAEMVCRLPEG